MSTIATMLPTVEESEKTTNSYRRRNNTVVAIVLSALALVLALLPLQPLIMSSITGNTSSTSYSFEPNSVDAGALPLFCGTGLGGGMDSQGNWGSAFGRNIAMDAKNRTWTVTEAFGSNIKFPHYKGEGGADTFFTVDVGKERGKGIGNFDKNLDKYEALRKPGACLSGVITSGANVIMLFSTAFAKLSESISTFAFDPGIVCKTNEDSGDCVNLIGIIGGDGSEGSGIIGLLTESIYMPLLVFVFVIVGFWILKQAIGMRFREALSGLIWSLAALIIGLAMLLNGSLIARAPVSAMSATAACVTGALQGHNCFTDTSAPQSKSTVVSSDKMCQNDTSDPSIGPSRRMSMMVSGLGCSITKAFVLEPYARANFGKSLKDLDTSNAETKKIIEDAGLKAETFNVPLTSSKSGDEMKGSTLELDAGPSVSNVAIYQLYLMTDAKANGNGKAGGGVDKRWYNVVSFASQDPAVWETWSPNVSGMVTKFSYSMISLITSFLGTLIIFATSIFALAYYMIVILMMAVFPFFALLAIHPGRGKQIFMGWLSPFLSNFLKYVASAIFLILTIAIYGSVLASASNPATTLILVVILSAALWLYRHEIIGMLGRVDMAGEKFSNSLGERIKGGVDKAKKLSASMAGGALGAGIATGSFNPKKVAVGATAGARDAAQRELKRGGKGVVANALREIDRQSADTHRDLDSQAKIAENTASELKETADKHNSEYNDNVSEANRLRDQYAIDEAEAEKLAVQGDIKHQVENRVIMDAMNTDPNVGDALEYKRRADEAEAARVAAEATGNTIEAAAYAAERDKMMQQYNDLTDTFDPDDINALNAYNKRIEDELNAQGVKYGFSENATLMQLNRNLASVKAEFMSKVAEANASARAYESAAKNHQEAYDRAKDLRNAYIEWQPGDVLRRNEYEDLLANAGKNSGSKVENVDRVSSDIGNGKYDPASYSRPGNNPTSGDRGNNGPTPNGGPQPDSGGPTPNGGDKGGPQSNDERIPDPVVPDRDGQKEELNDYNKKETPNNNRDKRGPRPETPNENPVNTGGDKPNSSGNTGGDKPNPYGNAFDNKNNKDKSQNNVAPPAGGNPLNAEKFSQSNNPVNNSKADTPVVDKPSGTQKSTNRAVNDKPRETLNAGKKSNNSGGSNSAQPKTKPQPVVTPNEKKSTGGEKAPQWSNATAKNVINDKKSGSSIFGKKSPSAPKADKPSSKLFGSPVTNNPSSTQSRANNQVADAVRDARESRSQEKIVQEPKTYDSLGKDSNKINTENFGSGVGDITDQFGK